MNVVERDVGPGVFIYIEEGRAALFDERDAACGLRMVGGVAPSDGGGFTVWFESGGARADEVAVERTFASACRKLEVIGRLYYRNEALAFHGGRGGHE